MSFVICGLMHSRVLTVIILLTVTGSGRRKGYFDGTCYKISGLGV